MFILFILSCRRMAILHSNLGTWSMDETIRKKQHGYQWTKQCDKTTCHILNLHFKVPTILYSLHLWLSGKHNASHTIKSTFECQWVKQSKKTKGDTRKLGLAIKYLFIRVCLMIWSFLCQLWVAKSFTR